MAHTLARLAAAIIIAVGGIAATESEARSLSLIRDSEIEDTLRHQSCPFQSRFGLHDATQSEQGTA